MTASYFGDFQPEELSLILSVPYRAGVWISHIDDAPGTQRDEAREEMALGRVLDHLHNTAAKGGFVREVLGEIIGHKGEWAPWGSAAGNVLEDAGRALSLIDARLPQSEGQQYRQCIFHVAKTVAMAAHEGADPQNGLENALGGGLLARLSDWLSAKSGEQIPANISGAEKDALQKLLHCLKKH